MKMDSKSLVAGIIIGLIIGLLLGLIIEAEFLLI